MKTKRIYGFRTSKAVKGLGVAVIGLTIFGTTLVSANEIESPETAGIVAEAPQDDLPKSPKPEVVVPDGYMIASVETVTEVQHNPDFENARKEAVESGVTLETTPTRVVYTKDDVEADFDHQLTRLEEAKEAQVLHDTELAEAKKEAETAGVKLKEAEVVTYRNDGVKAKADVETQIKALEDATATKTKIDARFKESVELAKSEGVAVTVLEEVTHKTPDEAWKDAISQIDAVETAKRVQFEVDALIDKQKRFAKEKGIAYELGETLVMSDEETAKAKVQAMTDLLTKATDLKTKSNQLVKDLIAKAKANGTVVKEVDPITLSYKTLDQAMANLEKEVNHIIDTNNATRKVYEAEKAEAEKFNKDKADKNARIKADNNKLTADYEQAMEAYKTSHAQWTKAKADFLAQEQAKVEANAKSIAEAKAHNDKVESDYAKALSDWEVAKANVKPSNEAEVNRIKAENAEIKKRNAEKKKAYDAKVAEYTQKLGQANASDVTQGKPVKLEKGGVTVYGDFKESAKGSYGYYSDFITVSDPEANPNLKVLKAPINLAEVARAYKAMGGTETGQVLVNQTPLVTGVVGETTDGIPVKMKMVILSNADQTNTGQASDGYVPGTFSMNVSDNAIEMGTENSVVRYDFMNATTGEPISLLHSFVFVDVDDDQKYTFEFNDGIVGLIAKEGDSLVSIDQVTDKSARVVAPSVKDGGQLASNDTSIPHGSLLVVGKGSSITVTLRDGGFAAWDIFGASASGVAVVKPKAPTAPQYEALKPVPELEAGIIPPKPVKAELTAVPDVYVAKAFETKAPTAPTKPTLTPLDTRPDKVVKDPTYQVAIVHGFGVKLEKGDLAPIQMSVTVHESGIEVEIHSVTQIVEVHDVILETDKVELVALPQEEVALVTSEAKEEPKAVMAKAVSAPKQMPKQALPQTGDTGSVLGLVGTVLSSLGLVGLKRKKD